MNGPKPSTPEPAEGAPEPGAGERLDVNSGQWTAMRDLMHDFGQQQITMPPAWGWPAPHAPLDAAAPSTLLDGTTHDPVRTSRSRVRLLTVGLTAVASAVVITAVVLGTTLARPESPPESHSNVAIKGLAPSSPAPLTSEANVGQRKNAAPEASSSKKHEAGALSSKSVSAETKTLTPLPEALLARSASATLRTTAPARSKGPAEAPAPRGLAAPVPAPAAAPAREPLPYPDEPF